jgi:hypothetical protein
MNSQLMKAGGLFHRQLAWVILFVVVFSALAPFISKLLANSKSIYWTEICTTSGTKLVAIDLNTKNIPDTVSKDNHCNYCFTKNHLSVLPTSSFSWGVTELVANRLIVSFSEVNNNNRYIRSAHPPRAPPQFI